MVVADEEDAPLTKVYAILNTEEGLDDFLNWTNEQDKHVLSRYGSWQSDYKRMLEDFSADIANILRAYSLLRPCQLVHYNTDEGRGKQSSR